MSTHSCKTFIGGYCPIVNKHVPRSWCFARCDKTKEYPSLIKQSVSFAKEVRRYVKAGKPKRPVQLIEILKKICEPCFYYNKDGKPKFQKKGPQCRECGCGLDLKGAWATSYCRKGYWDEVLLEWKKRSEKK